MRTFSLPCLFVLLVVPASLAEEKTKSDTDRFQGEWTITKVEQEGRDGGEFVKSSSPVMIFKDGRYTFKGAGIEEEVGEFKLDPKAKAPSLDYTIKEGMHKGKRQLGIYKFDGDTLIICLAQEGADKRPTEFKTGDDGPGFVMFTMKRKK
jgi:uncharacterized protein (TIGR03067 family)